MKYVFTGGGTYGHTNPAIAVAEKIRMTDKGAEILFFMREGGHENEAVKSRGFEIFTFPASGFKRNMKDPLKFAVTTISATVKCLRKIKKYKPDRIFGTGGYVSFAPAVCGMILKIPTYIHESNIVPGIVTRTLSRLGSNILLNIEETKKHLPRNTKTQVVGNPLLSKFDISRSAARSSLGVSDNDILIISFGGSGGSEIMNNVIMQVIKNHSRKNRRVKHIHATGKKYYDKAARNYPDLTVGMNGCKVLPYIENMPTMLRAADIVIARCGAMTLSEIAACGVASILIPSPNVTDNHQYKNGAFLADRSAAILLEEKDLTPERLTEELVHLEESKELRSKLGKHISNTVKSNAAQLISSILMH